MLEGLSWVMFSTDVADTVAFLGDDLRFCSIKFWKNPYFLWYLFPATGFQIRGHCLLRLLSSQGWLDLTSSRRFASFLPNTHCE